MSNCSATVDRMCDKGIVAVVRASSSDQLMDVARALVAGGVDCIEITMTTPNALQVIADARKDLGEQALVGVGSVLTPQMARDSIEAGAQFVVSPVYNPQFIELAHAADLPCVPGCFTPTEIMNATRAGADMVKVFPAGFFGPKYLKAIMAPMPSLRLTPTGGVDLNTAADWIAAGARTLGVGSALVTKQALVNGDMGEIESLAKQFVQIVADARAKRENG